LPRWSLEQRLLLWDSGFHSSWAIFEVCQLGGHVLGRLRQNVLLTRFVTLADGSYLTHIYQDQDHHTGASMLVRVISYPFTDPRSPGARQQVYRLVTTLLDPLLFPAKELAVLFHERWQAELVIGETRTVLRLSARTLRALTPEGVIQELYARLMAHTLLRTLMLRAASQQGIAPTALSLTGTIRILDESLLPLGMVLAPRRQAMVVGLLEEIGKPRLPTQRVRIQARVVKRVRSRYERKKPAHWHAPPLELELDFHQIIALVT
jgi:DDE family transposase